MKKSLVVDKTLYVIVGLLLVASLVLTGCEEVVLEEGELPVAEDTMNEEVLNPVVESDADTAADLVPQDLPDEPVVVSTTVEVEPAPVVEPEPTPDPVTIYTDGSYFQISSYQSPAGSESITIQLQLKDDRVTGLSVGPQATHDVSKGFQQLFTEGIGSLVVGKSLDEIGQVGAVNGSSLTPSAFNIALNVIKSEARS